MSSGRDWPHLALVMDVPVACSAWFRALAALHLQQLPSSFVVRLLACVLAYALD
jgi:hypothetical protein